ncbi:MAG: serine/threonine-protein kinase [Polyangiaceae bacterium]
MQTQPESSNGRPPASRSAPLVEPELATFFPEPRYALKRTIACSGTTCVIAAEHRFLHRSVAIKVLRQGSGLLQEERLRREVDALVHVRGSGVVDLLDAGEVAGKPYLVLELLEGRNLAGLLAARRRLTVAEAMKVGVEIATTLERCHQRGVIHGNLKPANLFVGMGRTPQINVIDFAVAHPIGGSSSHGVVLGTPEYMAPELLTDKPIDGRADQYSLGVTLYECLTGMLPFEGALGEVLVKHATGALRPVSTIRGDVPTALSQVIARLLQSSPENRFPSMASVAETLVSIAHRDLSNVDLLAEDSRRHESSAAAGPSAEPKPPTYVRRHRRAPYSTLARAIRTSGGSIDGRIEEVSEGGFQFVGERNVPSGETIGIRFALPVTGKILSAMAIARWTRSVRGASATGFEFIDIQESSRTEIAQYVAIMGADQANE